MALGVATAGCSFGQFALVPVASVLQSRFGDRHATMLVLAILSLLIIPLTLGLGEMTQGQGGRGGQTQSSREALKEAPSNQGFWLLTIGFFVCGFHVAFIGLYLPSYISDHATGLTGFGITLSSLEIGGWAIGLVGLFNIGGSCFGRGSGAGTSARTCSLGSTFSVPPCS